MGAGKKNWGAGAWTATLKSHPILLVSIAPRLAWSQLASWRGQLPLWEAKFLHQLHLSPYLLLSWIRPFCCWYLTQSSSPSWGICILEVILQNSRSNSLSAAASFGPPPAHRLCLSSILFSLLFLAYRASSYHSSQINYCLWYLLALPFKVLSFVFYKQNHYSIFFIVFHKNFL